jgi:hypothetical protein
MTRNIQDLYFVGVEAQRKSKAVSVGGFPSEYSIFEKV